MPPTPPPTASEPPPRLPFAEVLRKFRATVASAPYRGLICLGTGQEITAALLIAGLNPERVAILQTAQMGGFAAKVAHLLTEHAAEVGSLRCSTERWLLPEGDYVSTLAVYEGVRQVLATWPDLAPQEIAVDLTGGKSTMTVGLAKAAHVVGLASVYVNHETEGRFVIDGTQRLDIPPDPYTVFAELELREANRLAQSHDYLGAWRIYHHLWRRRQIPPELRVVLLRRATLARAYALWDSFDLRGARLRLRHLRPLATHAAPPVLLRQEQALGRLVAAGVNVAASPFVTLRNQPDVVFALLGSLYANALRRQAQGRLDIAALLLYRCLELISQRRLAMHDVDAAAERIALMKGYHRLRALADPLVAGYDLERIARTNKARNKSILAHGFALINRPIYSSFQAVVDELVERFLAIEGCDLALWQETFRFLPLEIFAVPGSPLGLTTGPTEP